MAEAAVSFVAERLTDLLDQIKFHTGVRKEIGRLEDELKRMRCFLRDADGKQDEDNTVRNWVSEIRNIAYEVEDLVDTFILKVDFPKKKPFVKRCTSYFTDWRRRSKIANELADIQLRLQAISASREAYGIRNIGEGTTTTSQTLRTLRRSSPRGEERDLVGLEEDTDKLAARLVQSGDRWRAVSIVGMGGIGKTTLARKVYNHNDIMASFPCRAWIYVSQQFNTRYTLQSILKQITTAGERLENFTDEELEGLLYDKLWRQRYLVVLDDIWNINDWNSLAKAFPARDNGSRLLITTRNTNVAVHADPQTSPYDLQFLNKGNSWELFCKKAFIDGASDAKLSPLLEEIGKEIVERCAGLPLAIIVIGGLLSRKRNSSEWQRVLNNMYSLFARDQTGVSAILALSYNDLPYYLKACFLYLGNFPEDSPIPTRKLFRLWVAEGLIPHQEEERLEDVAEDYLNELIDRNMVQVARMSVDRVKQCRLHDLLRDLAISKASIENFLEIPSDASSSSGNWSRRHPIYSSSHLSFLQQSTPHLRSLLFFRVVSQARYKYLHIRNSTDIYELTASNLEHITLSFKLLRVLDLEGISCSNVPNRIGELIHLKYLGLRETNLQVLPSTIVSLRNLQTLDIAGNLHLRIVPNVIRNLKCLRHLYMCGHELGYLQVDTLKHLQTLSEIHVEGWKKNKSANLTRLRKLGIRGNLSSNSSELFTSLAQLSQLQSLNLRAEQSEFPSLAQLASLRSLNKLHLRGRVTQFPSLQEFPPGLSHITLEHTRLTQQSIEILECLPELLVLKLKAQSYSKEKLTISAHGFSQLKFLELDTLGSLEELIVEEGSLTKLRSIKIINCMGLKMLPEEVKSLTTLHELHIEEMPKVFVDRLRSSDLHKVQHIPSIIFV